MAVTVYRDVNFRGPYAVFGPGFYSGQDLQGCPYQSTSCEDLDNAISSIRVDPNTIVGLYDSHSMTASGGGARVLIGPTELADLAAIGMNDRISSLMVIPYKPYESGIPRGGVALSDGYQMGGRRFVLRRGDYDQARLQAEFGLQTNRARAITVDANVIAVLYDGPNFDTTMDAVLVVGPATIGDLESVGMVDKISSVRVLYTDPRDVINLPTSPLSPLLERGGGRAVRAAPWIFGAEGPTRREQRSNRAPTAPRFARETPAAAPQVILLETSRGTQSIPVSVFVLIVLFIVAVAVAAVIASSPRDSRETTYSPAGIVGTTM